MQLKEFYVIEIMALSESIKSMSGEFHQYGKNFSMEKIPAEIQNILGMKRPWKTTDLMSWVSQELGDGHSEGRFLEQLTAIKNDLDFRPMVEKIAKIKDSKLFANSMTEDQKLELYQKMKSNFLPKEVLEIEKKTGFEFYDLKEKVKVYEAKVEAFYDLYEKILAMDNRTQESKVEMNNTTRESNVEPTVEARGYMDMAASFFTNLFYNNNPQTNVEEVKSSWWKVDLFEWFGITLTTKVETKDQGVSNTSDLDPSIKAEGPTERSSKVDFSDQSIINELHKGYQRVMEYGVAITKAECFARATEESMRVTDLCMAKRSAAARNYYGKDAKVIDSNDNNNQNNANGNMAAVLIPQNGVALVVSEIDSSKEVINDCHNLIEQAKNMVENCNYMFGMATPIDDVVTDRLKRALSVEAEVTNGEIVINAHGNEIPFHDPEAIQPPSDEECQNLIGYIYNNPPNA